MVETKYKEGQKVWHRLDNRFVLILYPMDLPNASTQIYQCRYLIGEEYHVGRFRESELQEKING